MGVLVSLGTSERVMESVIDCLPPRFSSMASGKCLLPCARIGPVSGFWGEVSPNRGVLLAMLASGSPPPKQQVKQSFKDIIGLLVSIGEVLKGVSCG